MRVGLVDVTGQRFGKLVALRYVPAGHGRRRHWLCRCDCGELARIDPCSLHSSRSRSCGCGRGRPATSLVGQTFGRLRVLGDGGRASNGGLLLRCECACGFVGRYRATNVRAGNTRSCGCLRVDVMRERRLVVEHRRAA